MISTVEKIYEYLENNFVGYKLTLSNGKIMQVPLDESNADYQAIQEWIAEGNTVIDNGGNE